jgi:AraC-like DNA-binding protein
MELFDYNPSKTTVEIKRAFSYIPRILNNHIIQRKTTGLLYILSGEYCYSYENSSFSTGSNGLIYLPANSVPYDYRVSEVGGEPVKTMQIEFELMDVSRKESLVYSTHPMLLTKSADSAILDCFRTIISEQIKIDPLSRLMVYSEMFKLLSLCAGCKEDAQIVASHRKIAPAIEFIQDNYKSSFSVSELAAICYISESQVRRLFLDDIGMSPIRYKNKLLLQEACKLINSTDLSIGEISEILGFCDIYAFSHFFRKYKGLSPTEYKTMKNEKFY